MLVERRRLHQDRRQIPRIPAVFAVKNTVGAGMQLGQAEDICAFGMTLKRPEEPAFASDTPVTLIFELPGTHQEIAVAGFVVTDSPTGPFRRTGVRFAPLKPAHQELIVRYCQTQTV